MKTTTRALATLVSLFLATGAMATTTELSVGLHFGADYTNSVLAPSDVAGVPGVTQGNWNNLEGRTGTTTNVLYGDIGGSPVATAMAVTWSAHLSAATTGAGKENNGFATNSADRVLMTGFLDTAANATTKITITGIPLALSADGFDVYIYGLSWVAGAGGAYRITDANGNLLYTSSGGSTAYQSGSSATNASTYILMSASTQGDYLVFRGLVGVSTIIVEATTANNLGIGSAPTAAVNAVQLVGNPVPSQLLIGSLAGSALGFQIGEREVGASVTDTNTISLKLNGTAVTATALAKDASNPVWTITYAAPTPLASGSANQVDLTVKDKNGNSFSATRTFTVGTYTSVLSPSLALASGAVDKTKPGFIIQAYQVEALTGNGVDVAEDILAGKYGANVANPTGVAFDGYFHWTNVINFDIATNNANGHFNTPGYVDYLFPGIPGLATSHSATERFAVEAWTAIEFPTAGVYTMIVNSDDDFRTYAGRNLYEMFQALGEFASSGGRGADDGTTWPGGAGFTFVVPQAGIYPFRTVYEQGTGGGNMEWMMVSGGNYNLLNDSKNSASLKTYQYKPSTSMPHLTSVTPGRNASSLGIPGVIKATVVDGTTILNPNAVTMQINGISVTPRVTKSGSTSTISFAPAPPLQPGTTNTITLTIADNATTPYTETVQWSFVTGTQIPAGSFIIEAEDFNYDGGKSNPKAGTTGLDVNVMPYLGGAYNGLGAKIGIDYSNNDNPGDSASGGVPIYRNGVTTNSDLYTSGKAVNITDNLGNRIGADRGSYTMTSNYRIGWVDNNEWYDYTRNIPAGVYGVSFAMSSGSSGDNMGATLGVVTTDPTQTSQTVVSLGTGRQIMDGGGWGNNILFPAKNSDGTLAAFVLPGGTTTLRVTTIEGDFDFFALVPMTTLPPKFLGAPLDGIRRDGAMSVNIQNLSTQVATNTIKLLVDGTDVTANSSITNNAIGVNVAYKANMFTRGQHSFTLVFSDNAATPLVQTNTGTFMVNPYPANGIFVVEAEDFDYNGGKWNPKFGSATQDVDQMPYYGAAYDGLGAVYGIDYLNDDNQDNTSNGVPVYRNGPTNIVNDLYTKGKGANIGTNNGGRWGKDRGTWTMTSNYKMGWTGGNDWNNYTRTFPTNKYEVWAALSYGDRSANGLKGKLSLVTAGVGTTNQTVQDLGVFLANGTGGWGSNELVPMKDTNGVVQAITFGGLQTIRFYAQSGDFDYLVFVPTTTVVQLAPTIVVQPKTTAGVQGLDVTLSVGVHGTAPFTYQWYKGFVPIAGATAPTLVLPKSQPADAGSYRVVINGPAGTAYSDVVQVTVTPLPAALGLGMYAGINITGSIGATYTIQYATNLTAPVTWFNAGNVTLATGTQFWVDMDSPKNPNRYYRAVSSP